MIEAIKLIGYAYVGCIGAIASIILVDNYIENKQSKTKQNGKQQ